MTDEKILELAAQFDDDSPEFAMSTEAVIAFARALIEDWDVTCLFSDSPAFIGRPQPKAVLTNKDMDDVIQSQCCVKEEEE
jgi:hypothetical protein